MASQPPSALYQELDQSLIREKYGAVLKSIKERLNILERRLQMQILLQRGFVNLLPGEYILTDLPGSPTIKIDPEDTDLLDNNALSREIDSSITDIMTMHTSAVTKIFEEFEARQKELSPAENKQFKDKLLGNYKHHRTTLEKQTDSFLKFTAQLLKTPSFSNEEIREKIGICKFADSKTAAEVFKAKCQEVMDCFKYELIAFERMAKIRVLKQNGVPLTRMKLIEERFPDFPPIRFDPQKAQTLDKKTLHAEVEELYQAASQDFQNSMNKILEEVKQNKEFFRPEEQKALMEHLQKTKEGYEIYINSHVRKDIIQNLEGLLARPIEPSEVEEMMGKHKLLTIKPPLRPSVKTETASAGGSLASPSVVPPLPKTGSQQNDSNKRPKNGISA